MGGFRGRSRFRTFLGALALGLAVACTSPTLPLPPPALPTILTGSEPNTFRLVSMNGAQPNALVIAVSRNEALPSDQRVEGTLADAQGSWELVVVGNAGDVIDLSQQSGELRSPTTTVILR